MYIGAALILSSLAIAVSSDNWGGFGVAFLIAFVGLGVLMVALARGYRRSRRGSNDPD